jgi:hypothetical protein
MRQVLNGYVEHIGSTRDSAGTVFAAVSHGNQATKQTDCVIFRFGLDGSAKEIFRFRQSQFGKAGHCTLEVLPDGTLWCGLSMRNAAGQQVFAVELLPGQAAPYNASAPGVPAVILAPQATHNTLVDAEARRVATEAKQKADKAYSLAERGGSSASLTRESVEAIAWQKGRDAALADFVWRKAIDAAWAVMVEHGVDRLLAEERLQK